MKLPITKSTVRSPKSQNRDHQKKRYILKKGSSIFYSMDHLTSINFECFVILIALIIIKGSRNIQNKYSLGDP